MLGTFVNPCNDPGSLHVRHGQVNAGRRVAREQNGEVRARLAKSGLYPIIETPEAFRQIMEQQTARWRDPIKRANIPRD
jgi:hypothetical protein